MPFDPSQPFEVAEQETGFDPSKPFEVVDDSHSEFDSTKPYEVVQENQPEQRALQAGPKKSIRQRLEDLAPSLLSSDGTALDPETPRGLIPHALKAFSTSPLDKIPHIENPETSPVARLTAAALAPWAPDSPLTRRVGAGAADFLQGTAQFATSPIGLATAGVSEIPAAARLLAGAFTPLMAAQAGGKISEGVKNRDPRALTEGALLALTAGLTAKHALTPKPKSSIAELEKVVDETIPKAEVEPLQPKEPVTDVFDEVAAEPVAEPRPVPVEQKVEQGVEPAAVEVKPEGFSTGPGAASPGDVPLAPQERQLIEAMNQIPASVGSGERVKLADQMADAMTTSKDAFSKWWLRTKAGAEQYKRLLLGAPLSEDNFWSTKKDWQANRQVNAGVAKEVIETGLKNHPSQLDRQGMGKYAEALMFDDPEGMLNQWADKSKLHGDRAQYEKAMNLTEDQKMAARTAIQYFEAKGKELQDAGLLNNMIEDYAGQHMVDRSGMGSPAMNQLRADLVRGTFNTNFKYAMRRVFETEADLEQAGYKLKTTDIFDKLANYGKTAQDVLADRAAVKAWMAGETPEGKPMFATGQHRIPIDGTEARPNAALLVNPKVRPDPKWTDPKTGAETDISGEYVRIDHPAFRKWQWAETTPEGKQIMVQGDVWAHKTISDELKNTFGRSHLYDVPGIDTATRVNAQLKGLKLVGLFHQVKTGTHALTHLVNPVGQPKINPHDPFTYEAMRSGLQLFNTGGAELFSEGLASSSILHKFPGAGPILRRYQDYLFHDYIPRIKLATYRAALERNTERYGKKVSESDLKQITANQVNSAYGELNWKLLGVNPTFHHALRLALLAPDFQAAQHGFVAQMFTKTGGENRMAAAIMIGAVYTGARILNKIFDNDFHFEPKRMFGVVIGGREYGFRTIASDVQRMFTDTSQFVYHRLSPIASSAVELLTKKDAMGRLESGKQAVKNVALRAAPIPLTPRDDITFKESALAGTLGYYGKRASALSDVKQSAVEWRKKNFPRVEDDEVVQYPISKYSKLRHALADKRTEDAQAEVNKLLADGVPTARIIKALAPGKPFTGSAKTEGRWRKSLNADDQKRLEKAKAEEREMYLRLRQLKLKR